MNHLKRRIVIIGLFAVLGVAVGMLSPNPAQAGWYNCPENPGHVAYNPVTGNSMRVGHEEHFLSPNQALWLWLCLDDGGLTGAHSVGTATYYLAGRPGALQHTPICSDATGSGCTQTYVGVWVEGQDAGAVGAKPCVSPVVQESNPCVSAGATPSPSSPVTTSVHNPTSGGICGVNVAGTCAVQEATVTAGGTAGTVYVGTTPTTVALPDVTVCTNRAGPSGYSAVSVNPGTSC